MFILSLSSFRVPFVAGGEGASFDWKHVDVWKTHGVSDERTIMHVECAAHIIHAKFQVVGQTDSNSNTYILILSWRL